MKQIDWSKAPKEATHYDCRPFISPAFMRKNHNGYDWEFFGDGHWIIYGQLSADQAEKLISRPIPWSGEGLPPVGIDVEINNKGGYGVVQGAEHFIGSTCKVMAVFTNMHGFEIVSVEDSSGACMCFRAEMCGPVRTPEQIEAEIREKTVQQMLSAVNFTEQSNREIFRQLYDLGYRKFEIHDES